jgi:hypothetical protein
MMMNNWVWKAMSVLLALPLLVACQWITEDHAWDDGIINSDDNLNRRFVNFSISVNTGNNPTRAGETPLGGENGDGREAGFHRENTVTGATFFFYQDDNGINGQDGTQIVHEVYYVFTPETIKRDDAGTEEADLNNDTRPGITPDEYVFTTGDQLLDEAIKPASAYHVIAVLNANLTGKNLNTVEKVRNYTFTQIYNSNNSNNPEQFSDFIMTSEQDYTMQLSDGNAWEITSTPTADYYRAKNFIRVERLTARIDFWAAGSNGYKDTYSTPGYEYTVKKSNGDPTNDRFVLTGVMPFNLNAGNGTSGGEFLIKRLASDMTNDRVITYLADETTTNYVIDPATLNKTDGNLTYYQNTLASLVPLGGTSLADVTTLANNSRYHSVAARHAAVIAEGSSAGFTTLTDNGRSGEDIIVDYPMENTLWSASLLYNYATGLALEGDYYAGGTGTPEHRVYYGYLRHQGTASSYQALRGEDVPTDATAVGSVAMEYGIVRNNIYRICIQSITSDVENPKITLLIKVKKWDKFVHAPIYM